MPRLYHPQYERKFDKRTRTQFGPMRLDGRLYAAADVTDDAKVADLVARGFLYWPGEGPDGSDGDSQRTTGPAPLPDDLEALTIPMIRGLAAERNVDLGPRGTKADLIAALIDATTPKAPPAPPPVTD